MSLSLQGDWRQRGLGAYASSRDGAVLTSGAEDKMISFNSEISIPSSWLSILPSTMIVPCKAAR